MNATERIQVLQQFDSLRAVSWIIGILALIANISVIIWMVCYMYNPLRWFSQRNPRNITNNPYLLIIFNLAIADLLGALYLIILAISDATFKINGDFQTPNGTYINNWIVSPTCFLERILSQVSLLMSIFITFFITVSRFIQVVCPYSGLEVTIKKSRIALLSLWIISFTIAIVGAMESSHVSLRKQDHLSILGFLCQLESLETPVIIGIVYSELLLGIIGYVGTIILYLIIACKLKKTRSSINSISRSKAESKIHLIIAWIVVSNVITWVPITLLTILEGLIETFSSDQHEITPLLVLLLYLNTAVNPIVYLVVGTHTILKRHKKVDTVVQNLSCKSSERKNNHDLVEVEFSN